MPERLNYKRFFQRGDKVERSRRLSLAGAMILLAMITLVVALIVQSWKMARQEEQYRAESARYQAEIEVERQAFPKPNPANLRDDPPP
jgi:type II secretory pathway component PulL